jgi:hypothetical protein
MGWQTILLSHRWRFSLDEGNIGIRKGWYRQGISVYRGVLLPHTYNIEGGTGTYCGVAWYEYHLDYDESLVGRRLYLQCNGIYRDADYFTQTPGYAGETWKGYAVPCVNRTKKSKLVMRNSINLCWRRTKKLESKSDGPVNNISLKQN